MKKYYGIVGAGGHGREVMPLVKADLADELSGGQAELFFVVEGDVESDCVNGYRLISLDDFLNLDGDVYFNIAIAASQVRARIANICESKGAMPFAVVADNVVILDANEIGCGAMLSPFVTITSNVKIGRFFHANTYVSVAHDCVIGDFVTFAPGVRCNGNVRIEDHAYIGSGACIIQGKLGRPLTIGQGAIVGMGAVVINDVPAGVTVVGNPARPVKSSR